MTFEALSSLFIRVLPGVIIGIIFLLLLPKRNIELKIFSYILLFILFRDTLTPLGLWSFGSQRGFWIRFTNDPYLLIILGVISFLMVFVINLFEPDLQKLIVWKRGSLIKGGLWGLLGAIIVVLPIFLLTYSVPIAERGGDVPRSMLVSIFILALLGNFLEEALFRGYFQGYMEKYTSRTMAAVLSGLIFGFGHIFLAITVTNAGLPLLIFVVFEGLVAAFVRKDYGVLPATLTHGLAIFFLASGLF